MQRDTSSTRRVLRTPSRIREDSMFQNTGNEPERLSRRESQRRSERSTEIRSLRSSVTPISLHRYGYVEDRSRSPGSRLSRRDVERLSERRGERRIMRRSPSRNRRGSRLDAEPQSSRRRKRSRENTSGHRSCKRGCEPKRSRREDSCRSTGRRENRYDNNTSLLDSFIEAIKSIKSGTSEKFPTLNNVIPEFDPMVREQTIDVWISKVEECKEIYGWSERQLIHYALPKLGGLAKTWYQSLPTVLFTWDEWRAKLMESFPSSQNYGELLTEMLSKRLRFGESPELYYYSKINLLNRCKIYGREAVDCLIYGIEDRSIRLGAQAAQFSEPEHLLKFFKTVKPGTFRDVDKTINKDKRTVTNNSNNQIKGPNRSLRPEANKIVCFNCNEPGHPSFKCSKPLLKCGRCNLLGHTTNNCPKLESSQKADKGKNVLNVATERLSSIYLFPISINGTEIQCHLDLGSECTLIRLTDALNLGIKWKTENLPFLKGLGNVPYQPIGKSLVSMEVKGLVENDVEVLIIEDTLINYPVLLGHSFTERPNIKITKTADNVLFTRIDEFQVYLVCANNYVIKPGKIEPILIKSKVNYSGTVYVDGMIRGPHGSEYYLFPGEYKIVNNEGRLFVLNMSDKDLIFDVDQLLIRSKAVSDSKNVLIVNQSIDNSDFEPEIGENVTNAQKCELMNLLLKYKECFSNCLKDLGFTTVTEMTIHLKDDEPVVYRPYRLSYSEREEVQRMVAEMLDCGIVRESSSPYASPIVIVKKKSGEKRLCVDYRALNNRTKRDHYPLPRVEDLLDQLSGNNLFISLDLASGYYQIPISKESQEKTAFVTPDGQYEYTRMPFGLANAPSVFQRAMHKILNKAKVNYVIVYMDDVLIPARGFDEAITRLEKVLVLLREGGLTLKLKKCKFLFNKLDFLGFEISSEGVKPGCLKTEAVSRFPTPTNQHDVRRFIGLASFFRRFVKGFAIIARPLTSLLRKDSVWRWDKEESSAFEALKECLISRPTLALYDKNLDTQLHTDACKIGVAGILLQKDTNGLWRPVAYYSRQTTADEQKFHSFELKTLAVIASLSKFRVYLLGLKFKIITDCHSLRTTLTKRDLVPRISRWWIQLQEFDCEFEYRPCKRMAHVDALSRGPVDTHSEPLHVLDVFCVSSEDWIATVQSSDDEIKRIKEILLDPESVNILEVHKNYKVKNGKVFRVVEEDKLRWVVPRGSLWQILKANHDDVGHFGIEKTLDRIRALHWFPKMRAFVKKYVSSCLECAHHKMPSGAQQGQLHPIEKIEIPFHTIHADHLGPFNKSKKKNSYILVIIDAFTKFINLTPVKSTKSSETIKVLKSHISYFGTPTRLVTDRGSCFTSNKFKKFTQSLGIKHILNAVSTPRANGQVERYNRTILASLGAMTHNKDSRSWDQYLSDVQLGINTTVHNVTKKTPTELLFGRTNEPFTGHIE